MPTLHDLLSSRFPLPSAHRPLMVFAAIVAISLLSFYIHLLHESMALGEQSRELQGSTKIIRPLKGMARHSSPPGSTDRSTRLDDTKR